MARYRIREIRIGDAVHYQVDRRWFGLWRTVTESMGVYFSAPIRFSSLESAQDWIKGQTELCIETVVWQG